MTSLTHLAGKTLRYLRSNGVVPTAKKVLRRLRGNDWLPAEEDHLYLPAPCVIAPEELWSMPEACVPFDRTVSVVIPAYNGAHELPGLLSALQTQIGIPAPEIVVVDSGSTDGTPELAAKAGAIVVSITQAEFSHSYARMLGAETASGEYLLFMTQDALPDRADWILRMLQPCLLSQAAAVSCYETPKPGADLLSHVTVWNWKQVMSGGADKLTRLPADTSYDALRRAAQLSDNACLVKRSIFMELGGHRGAYAEDLDLGLRLLRAGYALGILSSISVVHSHNRPPLYHFKRAIVDSVNLSGIFTDFPYARISPEEGANRIFTACLADAAFTEALAKCPDIQLQTAEEFSLWTRQEFNRIIIGLKQQSPQSLQTQLFAPDTLMPEAVRSFLEPVWQQFGKTFRFDGELAALQGRYILHTLCPYLAQTGQPVSGSTRRETAGLLWQYFGQSAGYTLAASYLTNPADPRTAELVCQFSTGV